MKLKSKTNCHTFCFNTTTQDGIGRRVRKKP